MLRRNCSSVINIAAGNHLVKLTNCERKAGKLVIIKTVDFLKMKSRSKKRRAKGPIATFKSRKYRGNQQSKQGLDTQSNTTDNNDSDISFDVCVPEEVPASSSSASERKLGSFNLKKRDKGLVNDMPPQHFS